MSRYKKPAYTPGNPDEYWVAISDQNYELRHEDAHLAQEEGEPRPRYRQGADTRWRFCEDCRHGYWQPISPDPETDKWGVVEPKCEKCWRKAQ